MLTISPLILVVMLGWYVGHIKEGIIIIIPFIFLRSFAGGVHAKSSKVCFIVSTILLLALIYLSNILTNSIYICILMLFSSTSIIIFSPIENENKRLTVSEKTVYRILCSLLIFSFCILYFILNHYKLDTYALCIALGIILTAFLQLPCIIFCNDN